MGLDELDAGSIGVERLNEAAGDGAGGDAAVFAGGADQEGGEQLAQEDRGGVPGAAFGKSSRENST